MRCTMKSKLPKLITFGWVWYYERQMNSNPGAYAWSAKGWRRNRR